MLNYSKIIICNFDLENISKSLRFFIVALLNFIILTSLKIKLISILGLFLIFFILLQVLSGTALSFSFIPEPFIEPTSRDCEDLENKNTDDFFQSHERGVDNIFLFLILHMLRKFFIEAYTKNQEIAWKTGSFLFLIIHGSIFFGLVLCCTHLSDITLTIAANVINTIFLKYGKNYWFLFTDQTLNSDTLTRCAIIHYSISILCFFLGIAHALFMHYDHKDCNKNNVDFIEFEWLDFIFKKEIYLFIIVVYLLSLLVSYLYTNVESLNFEIFMWGDIGMNSDIRFLSVAPHWYFRSYMGWLLLCPHHHLGIFGMIYFMIILYFQVTIKFLLKCLKIIKTAISNISEYSIILINIFISLLSSMFYTNTMLPYGRFYNRILGNPILLASYLLVYIYLSSNINKYINIVFKDIFSLKNK